MAREKKTAALHRNYSYIISVFLFISYHNNLFFAMKIFPDYLLPNERFPDLSLLFQDTRILQAHRVTDFFAAIAMRSCWREKTQTKATYLNINNTTYSLLQYSTALNYCFSQDSHASNSTSPTDLNFTLLWFSHFQTSQNMYVRSSSRRLSYIFLAIFSSSPQQSSTVILGR